MPDSLTGLLNREELLAGAARLVESSSLLSAVLINIDDSKRTNTILSHTIGDTVIAEVARRVSSVMRPRGLVGRYGGDEILAVLPGVGTGEAIALAEQARDLVAATPIVSVGEPYMVSAEEIEELQYYGYFYGPLADGTYAVAAKRTRVAGYPRVESPSPGLPVTAAFASVAIGVATADRPDIQDLLRVADRALYEAKGVRNGSIHTDTVSPDSSQAEGL